MDVGFASAVANICEQAHTIAEQDRRDRYRAGKLDKFNTGLQIGRGNRDNLGMLFLFLNRNIC